MYTGLKYTQREEMGRLKEERFITVVKKLILKIGCWCLAEEVSHMNTYDKKC